MSSLDFNSFEEMRDDEEIKSMVYRATSKYRPYLDDDVVDSEIDFTLLKVWKLYDETKGNKVSTYLYNALFNNLNRLLRKKYKKPQSKSVNDDIFPDLTIAEEEAFELLDSLSDLEKDIVINKSMHNETFKDLAKKHDMKPYKVSQVYKKSLEKVKRDCLK